MIKTESIIREPQEGTKLDFYCDECGKHLMTIEVPVKNAQSSRMLHYSYSCWLSESNYDDFIFSLNKQKIEQKYSAEVTWCDDCRFAKFNEIKEFFEKIGFKAEK